MRLMKREKRPVLRWLALGGLALAILFAGGLGGWALARKAQPESPYPLVDEALALIEEHYLGEVPDPLSRQRGMIHGLVERLADPFSSYVEPAEEELQQDQLAGEYGGVGAFLQRDEEGRVFLVPFEEGPAAQARVQEGDILLTVDGVAIEPQMSLDQVAAMVRGPVGTEVTLTLLRGQERLEITVIRQSIELPSVTWFAFPEDPEIGVLVVSRFSQRTPAEIGSAVQELVAQGTQALILDLRGNTGGLLDAAVRTADLFLTGGIIVIEQERDGRQSPHRAEQDDLLTEGALPLAVLVDGGTASAAEVVAAALKENGRARLFGTRTYGKGSVQIILPLSDGSSLHLTTARWLTPSGAQMDGRGIEPDQVPGDEDMDALAMAVRYLREILEEGP
jgi:carboxyl-terminal processing protease